jgi:tight adherence protein C
MSLVLLLGIILTGVAVAFAVRSVSYTRDRRRETLAQVGAYGFTPARAEARQPRGLRELSNRLAESIGSFALRYLPESKERELLKLLRAAGHYQTKPATFLGYRIAFATILPLFWLWLAITTGALDARAFLAISVIGALGWVMPKFFLERSGTKRMHRIDYEMPELVDLLVTTVEAGIGFASSLQLVSRRIQGPLGQELRLALQEQNMGQTIEDALEHMLGRVDTPALRAFVQAILQGQLLGVSIGKILRDLATDMRKRRRQMAEERSHKAPTKILFPLVFLILPALMIVSIGGPMILVIRNLGSM